MIGPETDAGRARGLSLLVQVQAELERVAAGGALSPELERRYRADTGAERVRELRGRSLLAAFTYSLITLLLNVFLVVDPVWRNVAIQVTVTPIAGVLIMWRFIRANTRDPVRERAALAACLVYTLSVIVAVYLNPVQAAIYDLMLVAIPVNFVLVFIHLRMAASVVFLLASVLLLAVSVLLRDDLTGIQQSFPVGFLVALCGPTLFVVHNHERAARRIYLHGLVQRLRIEHLSAENESLAQLSTTDPLTGAANRRRLDRELLSFCAAPSPRGAFLLIDLDGFKGFNDLYGHMAGDLCLQSIAACMAGQLRRCDLLARFGGEEFAILLPGVGGHDALEMAERLRQAVQDYRFVVEGQFAGVTVSIGVAEAANCPDPAMLLGAADSALYAAKDAGRNCVCAAWAGSKQSFFEKKDQKTFIP